MYDGHRQHSENIIIYAGNNAYRFIDPLGLFLAIQVTLPNGNVYVPQTFIKNPAQAKSFGLPIGSPVAIAVPSGVDPQTLVNQWGNGSNYNGSPKFAWFWRPGGPNDYKLTNPMYDAFGNFEYGATGAAASFACDRLTGAGDFLHGGQNNQINTNAN